MVDQHRKTRSVLGISAPLVTPVPRQQYWTARWHSFLQPQYMSDVRLISEQEIHWGSLDSLVKPCQVLADPRFCSSRGSELAY